jgi:hypothetical protein
MCKFLVWHWIKKLPFSEGERLQMEGAVIDEKEVEKLCGYL